MTRTEIFTLALLDHLVHETSLTPLAHLICAGHSVHELERAVRLILGLGVRGFLALRGDIQEGQVSELPFARYLVELIRRVEREDFAHLAAGGQGVDWCGGVPAEAPRVRISVAGY